MKLNEECLRSILVYLHNNLDDSVYNLAVCDMIEGIDSSRYDKSRLTEQFIRNLSYRGLQFASNIETDTTWNKVKSIIGRVGSHSLSFIETVAHDLIVEMGKQSITVMMTQQPQQ